MNDHLKIGAVLFPGFELLDVYGPLEMFGMLKERASLVVLADRAGAIPSNQGPEGVAGLALADAGELDVLLVPGGMGTRREVGNPSFLELLRKASGQAGIVASVCTGSALLARAGLLDGKRATSNKIAWDWVVSQGPEVKWVRKARWVEDGKFFTSSGVSAGMDMALALIEKLADRESALRAARQAEYLWNEDPSLDPFAEPAPCGSLL